MKVTWVAPFEDQGGLEFLWERPMTLALVILALVMLVAPFLVDKLKMRDRLMSK